MTRSTPDADLLAALRRDLAAWYRANARDLPWRRDPIDPYAVLVSEAMLQQTQVATVLPYFERFLSRWPTVADLAAADEQDVLTQWQGLGYYRRARHLHAAARMIVDHFEGSVPESPAEFLKLPGVGRYTAGAIASIAHNQPAPILDGNVMRVFARWFDISQSIDDKPTQQRLWHLAELLVDSPDAAPRDINQGLMELGALVCTPRSPSCLTCPTAAHCAARESGTQDQRPVRTQRKKPRAVTHRAVAIERRGKWLFEQRPDTGLWSNMWQLPTHESLEADDDGDAAGPLAAWVKSHTGLALDGLTLDQTFAHQTTHRSITFEVWTAGNVEGRLSRGFAGCWRKLDAVSDLPLPNPQRRMVKQLREQAGKATE